MVTRLKKKNRKKFLVRKIKTKKRCLGTMLGVCTQLQFGSL